MFGVSLLQPGGNALTGTAAVLVMLPVATFLYAYVVYPVLLLCVSRVRPRVPRATATADWPTITITIPVYNEARALRATLEHVLELDYPVDRRQVLVISDASTDGTDGIAREFATRGVELIRLPTRAGKTAAENAAAAHGRGSIVVNIDATARPALGALKALVGAFADPSVGVASGRDVSTSGAEADRTIAESGYVGYEMWVRSLETRVGSIVGASGCFFAIRRDLYEAGFPEALSRDFASALVAREHGFRAVSVDGAVCAVPRTPSMDIEFRRKVRTMHRGLATLWYKRQLLDPVRYGSFAVMLFSHKLCRWLVPLMLPFAMVGLVLMAASSTIGATMASAVIVGLGLSALARRRAASSAVARSLALPSYVVMGGAAGIVAWWETFRRQREAIWEPTRRST